MLCGVGIDEALGQASVTKLNCKCQKLPIKYLGLPLGVNTKRSNSWQPVVDKIKSKLILSERKLLSFAGRVTLIKYVLSNLPCYYLSLFKLPKGVAKTIDGMQATFLWGSSEQQRKVHLVKWKYVVTSKKKGGLGIVNLREINNSLLIKWWWRYGVEEKALWRQVINSRYGVVGGGWIPNRDSQKGI